jgi:hypothetical protein
MSAVAAAIWASVAAAVIWALLEFVGKPFRAFFELKKDCLEVLTLYGNVGARGIYIHDDRLRRVDPRIVAKELRLQEAEAAFRKCGSKLQAFANTETLAVIALCAARISATRCGPRVHRALKHVPSPS